MAWDRKAPFYKETRVITLAGSGEPYTCERAGDMLEYESYEVDRGKAEMLPFEKRMTLRYAGSGRGRSSVTFYWRDIETENRYPMFLTDMDDLLHQGRIGVSFKAESPENTTAIVSGTWTACKRGQNYGIKRAEDK